jgi:WD40 repeat protein/mono/diheme cytochrome c family protein
MTAVRPFLTGILLALPAFSLAADTPPEKTEVSYYRQVRRIFQQHCQGCHQPAKPMGGYSMTEHADLFKKGDQNKVGVVAGKPEQSFLVEQIRHAAGGKAAMPKNKDPLADADADVIVKWIAEGAKDDTPANAREVVDSAHPPVYLLPPVITSIDWSPDGKLLAVAGFHEVLLHKIEVPAAPAAPAKPGAPATGQKPAAPAAGPIHVTPVARLIGLSERVQSVAFSPDGTRLAVAGGSPGRFGEIQIWDVANKRLKLSLSTTFDTVYGVSWSHDGSTIAYGCADNSLRAIDAVTGKQVLFQGAHNDWVLGTVFSRDSSYLVSISRDRSMKLTEVATQRFIDNVTSITPGALKGGLMALDRNPKKTDRKVKSTAVGTDMSEKWYDELIMAGADGTPRLYQMHRTTKRVIGDDANKLREYAAMPGRIYALRFSPDGDRFAAGSSLDGEGEVQLYQTADAKILSKAEKLPGGVYTLAWHPSGKVLAWAGFDGAVRLIDPATGKQLTEFMPVPLTTRAAGR